MIRPPPVSRVVWQPCWRIVSSLFPPRGLFDRVASRDDLEAVKSTLVAMWDAIERGDADAYAGFIHPEFTQN